MTSADPHAPAGVADALIAELEREAELVDRGSFDIDAERGLDKLARFQLADPSAHVLRLVEAGVLLGAATIRFALGRRELRASFESPARPVFVARDRLERLFSVLVGSEGEAGAGADVEGDPSRAALVQLAVAMLAAMRVAPLELSIESVGPEREGHRRVFVGRGQVKTEAVVGDPGTRILLVDPGRDVASERELLWARCRHAGVELFVDGVLVSAPSPLEGALGRGVLRDAAGERVGEAGFVPGHGPPVLVLAPTGVELERVVLDGLTPGFVAWAEVALARDLSQAKVRRTPRYDALVAVARAFHDETLPTCSEALRALDRREEDAGVLARWLGIGSLVVASLALLTVDSEAMAEHRTWGFGLAIVATVVMLVAFARAGLSVADRPPRE